MAWARSHSSLTPMRLEDREERLPNPSDPNAPTTPSYHRSQELKVMHEMKETVCEVLTPTWDDS